MNKAKPSAISMNNQIMMPDSLKFLSALGRRSAQMACCGLLLAFQGCRSVPEPPRATLPETPAPQLRAVTWSDLPGWPGDGLRETWQALLASCTVKPGQGPWSEVCARISPGDAQSPQAFLERWLIPHALADAKGNTVGLLTGYYEPLLSGSRVRTARANIPVYGLPPDLLQIDLSALYPELSHHRLRGRLLGRKVVPYHSRADIDSPLAPLAGQELLWVEDAVGLFFLQIQGSGRVALPDGSRVRLAYADQNGHPYRAIGKVLVERGQLQREEVSLQTIRRWLETHPEQASEVMAQNASYVFFEEKPDSSLGPVGSQGVPLTPGYSIAVDPRVTALGTPVYLDSTWPVSGAPLRRLAIAQDTGGAIRGTVRADLFLGEGPEAEFNAGHMKQPLRAWVLLPRQSRATD